MSSYFVEAANDEHRRVFDNRGAVLGHLYTLEAIGVPMDDVSIREYANGYAGTVIYDGREGDIIKYAEKWMEQKPTEKKRLRLEKGDTYFVIGCAPAYQHARWSWDFIASSNDVDEAKGIAYECGDNGLDGWGNTIHHLQYITRVITRREFDEFFRNGSGPMLLGKKIKQRKAS